MSEERSYEPSLKKASLLTHPAHKYIHTIIAHSFACRADNSGVVGWQELLFLYKLVERGPIHFGYALTEFIAHQGQHICLGVIFTIPYITSLI